MAFPVFRNEAPQKLIMKFPYYVIKFLLLICHF